MSDPLFTWLELWSSWLDELLASGLACPGKSTRWHIESWSKAAETLGYHNQAGAARELIASDTLQERRADLYHLLLVQHDLLRRLYYAQGVCERYAVEEHDVST
jgi:hypothetical protein